MNYHQKTATLIYDAWKNKRHHKSGKKYNVLKTNSKTDSPVIKSQTTAMLFYSAWNKKKRHKGIQKYNFNKTNEQNLVL